MAYVISELNLERQKLLAKVLAPVTEQVIAHPSTSIRR